MLRKLHSRETALLAALIHGFDGLNEEHKQVFQGAGAAVAASLRTLRADVPVNVVEIRFDVEAIHFVDRLQVSRQVHLDGALLAQRGTRRAARRFFAASAANVFSDFIQVFLGFCFGVHDQPPSGTLAIDRAHR
jgi:hypothetical protein